MSEVKILLLCSSSFAIPVLRELAFHKTLAVIGIPRHHDEMVEHVQAALNGVEIPVLLLDKNTFAEKLSQAIGEYQVTLGLIMNFSFRIPAAVYQLPEKGFFNVHSGPLPEYRGSDPVFQQIKNQERFAGVTVHRLSEGFDAGPIVNKEMIPLNRDYTYGMLTALLADLACRLVRVLVKLAGFDIVIPSKPQDESIAVYYSRQSAKDIMIDWQEMDANAIIALINACNPWNKGAVTRMDNRIIRLLEAAKFDGSLPAAILPGTIFSGNGQEIIVATRSQEAIIVNIIYSDEGFLTARRSPGISNGKRFG